MTYTTAEARQELLDAVAQATDQIGSALGALVEAYERLDEQTADTLEQELFGPVQSAYGRTQRIYAEYADRHGLSRRTFAPPPPGAPSKRVEDLLEDAVDAVAQADVTLAALQDSMLPVEFGDPALRAALEEVRKLLGENRARSRQLARTIGR
ncbi:MAG: hypothetical protein ACR2IP_07065 [Solirubrobacteraceae bacterium]